MSPEWRLLRDGITDAHHHFAVEEALVRLVDDEVSPPTLRLRQVRRGRLVLHPGALHHPVQPAEHLQQTAAVHAGEIGAFHFSKSLSEGLEETARPARLGPAKSGEF